jgi:pimeloyl-ACP methyl ester carboxylesterase
VNWQDIQLIRVPANGIHFEIATLGEGDRLALCLHGFPDHACSWRHQMPLLVRLGYRVWAPNLRGYGNTDSPREVSAYKISTLLEDVACLIQAAKPRETLVLAHDWGGALAWLLAMERPQLIDRLVVLNLPHPACFMRELRRPAQFLRSWYMFLFLLPWLPEFLLRRGNGRAAAELIRRSSRAPGRFPDDILEIYRANAARPGGLTAMLNWYRAAFRDSEIRRYSGKNAPIIRVPTLLLWGDADVALSLRTTRGTEQYVSDLTFRVLPGVSHWIQQEAPEAVNALLEAWLNGRRVPELSDLAPST